MNGDSCFYGVFRRYHVENNPINRTDSKGLQVVVPLPHPIFIVPIVIWITYDTIRNIIKDSCRENSEEDSEKERCHKVWNECIEKCSDLLPTPRLDQGNPFFKCVNRCLADNNCLGKL